MRCSRRFNLFESFAKIAGTHRYVGKETDRRWEHGDNS
jgi:hypothetical protein